MNSPRIRIIAIIALVVILVGAALYVTYGFRGSLPQFTQNSNRSASDNLNNVPANTSSDNTNASSTNTSVTPANTNTALSPDIEKQQLATTARSFASVYGSYSSETNFANLEALLSSMTLQYQSQVIAFINTERAKQVQAAYSGVTTQGVATKVEAFDGAAGTATVRVSCQRQETSAGATAPKSYQQDLVLTFRKVEVQWKVDGAAWQ